MRATSLVNLVLVVTACGSLPAAAPTGNYRPAKVIISPGAEARSDARTWQGIPGIERTAQGRLWATWYTGGLHEGAAGNYVAVATSGDDGRTWSDPVVLIKGPTDHHMLADPLPWLDPQGRLWIFYLQSSKERGAKEFFGACAVRNDAPEEPLGRWTEPLPVHAGGRIFGKLIVRASGGWLAPFFLNSNQVDVNETCVLLTPDAGANWSILGGTSVPMERRNFSEATLAQRRNGDLWTVMRTKLGLEESTSADDGRTWTAPRLMREGPHTRACMRKLASGAHILIYHDVTRPAKDARFPRARLAAWLSDDEGKTWPHQLLLDERNGVSYPDATEAPDGRIYFTYDRWRYGEQGGKEILMGVVREADIRAGKIVSPDARLAQLVNRATGIGNIKERQKIDEEKMREDVNRKLIQEGTTPPSRKE